MIFLSPGVRHPKRPFVVSNITLSGQSFTGGDPSGTLVGNGTISGSPGSFIPGGVTVDDTTHFQIANISGNTFELRTLGVDAAGSYPINITATPPGGAPFTRAFTITGSGAGATLGTWTLQEQSGGAQTNLPFEFGLPLKNTDLPSGSIIQVFDGATQLVAQTDLKASDLAGSNVRFVKVTGVLPSISGSASKSLTVKSVVGSAPTGTAIAASDITGLVSGTFEPALVTITLGGSTYTASCAAALAASSSWGLTTLQNFGAVRSGPYCTEFLCSAPLKTGGTAHNYLRAWFHVAAYKAASTAVTAQGGGNQILGVRVDVVLENGYAQTNTTTPVDLYYAAQIQSSTSLTNATLTLANNVILAGGIGGQTNWTADTTGAGTLTLGATTSSTTTTLTRSTGTWSADDNGRILTAGAGIGQICSVSVAGTSARLRIVSAFAGTSLTSGNYTLNGIGHAYATRWRQRVVIGNPVATADSTSQTITPWNGSGTRSVMPYMAASKMVPNYGTLPANQTNAGHGASAGYGARPYGALSTDNTAVLNGDLRDYFPSSGDSADDQMAIVTGAEVAGGILFDTDGQYRLFRTAAIRGFYPWHVRNKTTGLLPTINGGSDWSWDTRWGTVIDAPTTNGSLVSTTVAAPPHGSLDHAHHCGGPYLSYLLTGDWYYLEEMQFHGWWFGWAESNPGFAGSQLSRNCILDLGEQMRSRAWCARSLIQVAAITPDDTSLPLGMPKSSLNTLVPNVWAGAKTTYVDDVTNYGVSGPRWVQKDTTLARSFAQYQAGFFAMTMHHAKELGYLDSNGTAFKSWWAAGLIPPGLTSNSTIIALDWMAEWEWFFLNQADGSGSLAKDWTTCYQYTADATNNLRLISSTFSLSATSGAAINATITGTNPFAAGSFYVGGIIHTDTDDAHGVARVQSVSGATCVLDTTVSGLQSQGGLGSYNGVTFNGTTLVNPRVPLPAPADAGSPETKTVTAPHAVIYVGACAMMQDDGEANASSARSYYEWASGAYLPTSGTGGYARYYFVPR